ncbi:DUF6527 family protein [Actinoplanes teichomyceticus]|uniref:Uncharacterized protein n=1 Tax=Actinoplanes teichomyceticus TaxID=1867 RepID=A0A561VGI8_ACTTI|nr:DUF6527 family protein [Actinoplanes teichomyceticus]TWG10736.1 hypothetical protein FHX34_107232 [Actinoplanes teichomyceticus]GIF12640.1 hypothetical protein Ate01nite_26720 [Actinoplanes teichomyceticus]
MITRRTVFEHRFVDSAPEVLDDGVLYVSIPYATALHRCACGCGNEIVTPISRTGWSLTFDGASVTLHPSIGNWNQPCRSHYFIRQNRIQWARDRDPEIPARRGEPTGDHPTGSPGRRWGVFAGRLRPVAATAWAWLRRHLPGGKRA